MVGMTESDLADGASVGRSELTRDNHYVPRSYLKRWADDCGRIWSYRILASHQNVPLWKPQSTKGLAYHEHLYTRVVASGETDDIERWIEKEFESPAKGSIHKAVSNEKLTATDWQKLIRFLAAQDARTPARLMKVLKRLHETLPAIIEATLADSVRKLEAAKHDGVSLSHADHPHDEFFPGRVTVETFPEQEGGQLRFETVVGRGLWLFSLKQLLTKTVNALLEHKWTILRSPPGMEWLTSDDPVVCLNYHDAKKYDFGGGWGSKGTEIFLPLSPNHLMYTRIGEKPWPKGHVLSRELAQSLQRFTVEHAHRFVFGRTQDPSVAAWRPRVVDSSTYDAEVKQWRQWHEDQSNAERELFNTQRSSPLT